MTEDNYKTILIQGNICPVTGLPENPVIFYPSKWPSHFSAKASERYDSEQFTKEEKPRAIAYALSSTLALLLDGHFKAIDHMELSELVSCLLIIPHMKDRKHFDKELSFFADVGFQKGLLNSVPTFTSIEETDFIPYPVERQEFETISSALEKHWMLYPPAAVFYSDILSFLADNAARSINYHADIFHSIYPNYL